MSSTADDDGLYERFADVGRAKLSAQYEGNERLDKSRQDLVRTGSVVLSITLVLFQAAANSSSDQWVNGFAVGATVCYILLLVSTAIASTIPQLDVRPDLGYSQQWVDEHKGQAGNSAEFDHWLGRQYVFAYQTNQPRVAAKAIWVGAAEVSLYLEVLLLAGAVLRVIA